MSYFEWKNSSRFLNKEWKDEKGRYHREDGPAFIIYDPCGNIYYEGFRLHGYQHRKFGPAEIHYNPDGSIYYECFYLEGVCLGREKIGFWALWERLTEVERNSPSILKYLARYS
jgi:hypothetical protein